MPFTKRIVEVNVNHRLVTQNIEKSHKIVLHMQGIIQAVFEVGNQFWVHQNLHPNFDELAKNKNIKPHCEAYSALRPPPAFYNI